MEDYYTENVCSVQVVMVLVLIVVVMMLFLCATAYRIFQAENELGDISQGCQAVGADQSGSLCGGVEGPYEEITWFR